VARFGPFVVLLRELGAGQTDDGCAVTEDTGLSVRRHNSLFRRSSGLNNDTWRQIALQSPVRDCTRPRRNQPRAGARETLQRLTQGEHGRHQIGHRPAKVMIGDQDVLLADA
jgi:hypothetical protein